MFFTILNLFQTSEQVTVTESERYLLVYMMVVLFVLTTLIILFFVTFQKRKNKLLIEKFEQQKRFEEEIIITQQEIQEETLKHVGRELHDNIGQLLAVASMQINLIENTVEEKSRAKVKDTSNIIKDSLQEVRALSKSLNTDVIFNAGLGPSIANEVERINRMNVLEVKMKVEGEIMDFENKKDEVIVFRIFQEFVSNTIKYANAKSIEIMLSFTPDELDINISDDGDGFDISETKKGAGLINMENRAEMINATYQLNSEVGKGTSLNLKYPFKPKSN
ncbi:MAG: histidine kinase [Bacteroidetes bacterium MedPE-SWsnd-G2]|nr:MAG: histidine kinase [Bacteroidetes bacterium MedPE-SWsnd-G2]